MVKHELYQMIRRDLVTINAQIEYLEGEAFARGVKAVELLAADGSYPYLAAIQTRSNLLLALSNLEKK